MLTTLDHVIVAVRDLGEATRTYGTLLGRRPSWLGDHGGAGTRNTLFRLENTYLELLSAEGPGPVGDALRALLEARGEGPVGLAFGTDDAEACRKWLATRGLDPEPVEKGLGRDVESGAFREWLRLPLPLAKTRGIVLFPIQHLSPSEILPPSGATAEEASTVFALDHAVVQTPAPDVAIALYRDGLGLRLALDRKFEAFGMRLLFFRVGGVTVEVAAPLVPDPELVGDRFWGLSWRVGNADAARARLIEAGFDVSEVREGRRPGTRVLTVRGPTHGVATLLLEPPEPASA